ncbi:MAG: hypothetical protein NVS3B18_09550 [Candidatus Dormibacteria bacterium]
MGYILGMKQIAKVSGKNQTTIPVAVRRALGIHPGDRVVFELGETHRTLATVRRSPTLDEVAGSVPVPPEVEGLAWSEIRERAWTGRQRGGPLKRR